MLVVSDGDIIKNHVSKYGNPYPLGYNPFSKEHFHGNSNFIINTLHYMLGKKELIEIRANNFKVRLLNRAKNTQQSLTLASYKYWTTNCFCSSFSFNFGTGLGKENINEENNYYYLISWCNNCFMVCQQQKNTLESVTTDFTTEKIDEIEQIYFLPIDMAMKYCLKN